MMYNIFFILIKSIIEKFSRRGARLLDKISNNLADQ